MAPGGMAPGMAPGMGMGKMGGGPMMPGAGMPGEGMAGMPGMPGMGGMGMDPSQMDAPKYKLIRFFDFDVDPRKKYRYRVQVMIEDPNRPQEPTYAPDPRTLSAPVAQRVKAAEEAETDPSRRKYWRETDWSEPSGVVSLPQPERFLGGEVLAGRVLEIRDANKALPPLVVPLEEPAASVYPVVWDGARALEKPGNPDLPDDPKKDIEKPTAYRGTVLSFRKDTQVLRPDTLEVKLLEKHPFSTNAVVVDLRPSEPIRDGLKKVGETKEPPKSAGEVLLLDRYGQLVVRNELDDDEEVRRLMFRDEGAAPTEAGGADGMMPGGMIPGMMPGGAMPGMSPPGGEGKAGRGKGKGGF